MNYGTPLESRNSRAFDFGTFLPTSHHITSGNLGYFLRNLDYKWFIMSFLKTGTELHLFFPSFQTEKAVSSKRVAKYGYFRFLTSIRVGKMFHNVFTIFSHPKASKKQNRKNSGVIYNACCLELRQYKNGLASVKNMFFFKLPPFSFTYTACTAREKGNFKTSMSFTETNPFLYCLSSKI